MTLAVTDFGGPPDAPLLVLGPSLGTSAESLWTASAKLLTGRFRVIAWDLPGHGRSAPASRFDVRSLAADVLAAVDQPRFHHAGDSLGGAVGLQIGLDAPHRLASVTLFCSAAQIGEPAAWRERATQVRAGGTGTLLGSAPDRWFGPGFADRDPAAADALLAALADTDDESYAAACDALADFDVRDRLPAIETPLLAVAGTADTVVPVDDARALATAVRHGWFAELDGVAHLAPAEAPERAAAFVERAVAAAGTLAELRSAGLQVRREVLGDEYVDRALTNTTEFTGQFQEFITRYAWGGVWTRPGLDRRARSLITLTALATLGHDAELALHVRAALRNGLTRAEIEETLLQVAVYCGVPAANTAFRVAQGVFDEDDSA